MSKNYKPILRFPYNRFARFCEEVIFDLFLPENLLLYQTNDDFEILGAGKLTQGVIFLNEYPLPKDERRILCVIG